MIKHIVLLKWKAGATQSQIDALSAGFRQLANEIDEIQSYSFGRDAGLFPGNADYALVAEFASEADLKAYVVHPQHQALLADLAGPILDSFQSVQYLMTPA